MAVPDRILFGSCNSQHHEPVLWPSILSRNASAFVWAGDAIYADDFRIDDNGRTVPRPATPEILDKLYRELLESPGYKKLIHTNMTILGALDDHDYGCNNGDKTYPHRVESAISYVNFLQQEQQQNLSMFAQRARAGKGVYGVKVLDFGRPSGPLLSDEEAGLEPGMSASSLSNRSVAVFILDIRSNKTPWRKGRYKYLSDYEADFLGEEQWTWLEQALERSTATVNILVQGLQVHADRYFDGNLVEDWSRFPMAQHRLYQAILKAGVSAPILVSGDVHMAQLLRKDCRQGPTFLSPSRMLLEVTSSGMTHSWGSNICARPVSRSCRSAHMARSLHVGMHLAHINHAWTDLVDLRQSHEGSKSGIQYALQRNFGEFEFDWDKRQVIVRIFGEETNDMPFLSTAWGFDLLSGLVAPLETGKVRQSDFQRLSDHLKAHGAHDEDWVCVNYRGHPHVLLKAFGVASPVLLAASIFLSPVLVPLILACTIMRRRRKKKRKQS